METGAGSVSVDRAGRSRPLRLAFGDPALSAPSTRLRSRHYQRNDLRRRDHLTPGCGLDDDRFCHTLSGAPCSRTDHWEVNPIESPSRPRGSRARLPANLWVSRSRTISDLGRLRALAAFEISAKSPSAIFTVSVFIPRGYYLSGKMAARPAAGKLSSPARINPTTLL